MNLKYASISLCKKLVFTMLTLIQLIAITVSMINIFHNQTTVNNESDRLYSAFNDGEYYIFNGNNTEKGYSESDEELKKVEKYLQGHKEDITVKYVQSEAIYLEDKNFINNNTLPMEPIVIEGKRFLPQPTYSVNENIFKNKSFKFFKGNGEAFTSKESMKKENPIILGFDFKDKYKVGDEIELIRNGGGEKQELKKHKVVGILERSSQLNHTGTPNNMINTNQLIIMPFITPDINEGGEFKSYMSNLLSFGYFSIDDGYDIKELKNEIKSYGLEVEINSINEVVNEYNDQIDVALKPIKLFLICILIFTMISMTITFLNMVLKEVKDYGVHLLLGGTLRDIQKRILYEVMILLTISTIIGVGISSVIPMGMGDTPLNIQVLSKVFLAYVFIGGGVLLIPLYKLNKWEINELIRREE